MDILEKSSELIITKIEKCKDLFEHFEHVYLFGSVLELNNKYNDIDILLIYREYSIAMEKQLKIINNELEKICKSTIDLTVLSYEEEADVEFLKRLKLNYLKIK